MLRETLRPYANIIRLSDIAPIEPPAGPHEEVVQCNLADKAAVHALCEGVDAIAHFGGVSVERPFEEILEANIKGVFNIYEAARRHGIKRVIFASSNHVIGFYKQTEKIDASVARRPDSYYGLSKSYGEDVGHTVVYGVSANRDVWWDNHMAANLGFVPQDSSEVFREKIEQQPPYEPNDPALIYQGGAFCEAGPFED